MEPDQVQLRLRLRTRLSGVGVPVSTKVPNAMEVRREWRWRAAT